MSRLHGQVDPHGLGRPPARLIMSYHIRCSKEVCKLRYALSTHPDDTRGGWKCKKCGGVKFRWIKNRKKERGSTLCNCLGYMWMNEWDTYSPPHRRGSRACHFNLDGSVRDDPDGATSPSTEGGEFWSPGMQEDSAEAYVAWASSIATFMAEKVANTTNHCDAGLGRLFNYPEDLRRSRAAIIRDGDSTCGRPHHSFESPTRLRAA